MPSSHTDPDPGASSTRSSTPDSAAYHDAQTNPSDSSPPASPSADPPNPPSPHQNDPSEPPPRFTAEEESRLLAESTALKATANATFSSGDYSQAISQYDQALSSCPTYLDYETAVLKSNIAACHLKLSDWKAAVAAATAALDALERLLPTPGAKKKKEQGKRDENEDAEEKDGIPKEEDDNDTMVELDEDEDQAAQQLAQLQLSDDRRTAILRIRSKSLLRRARAKSALDTWSELQGALDDYKILSDPKAVGELPQGDRKVVQQALRELPGRVKMAQEREMGEMMGKLKELGNGILKPFGLSTDMFRMEKGEGGGYSFSMNQ